jgi:hypothetical protein
MQFWPTFQNYGGLQAQGNSQPAQQTSGARRQKRQRQLQRSQQNENKAGAASDGPTKTLPLQKVQDLRRAVKNNKEAGGQALRQLSGSEDGSSTNCSSNKLCWADANEDEFPTVEQVTIGWGNLESNQYALCLADTTEADSCEKTTISRRAMASAAKDWQANSEQAHGNISLQKATVSDDSLCPEPAADPVLLALEDPDGETFRPTLDEVVGSVWWLGFTKRGCRIAQKAIEVGTIEDQNQILGQMQGRVLEALKSPHANHVLQKCIEIMPPDQLQFAITEIRRELPFAARHRFGCRIIQRLIEHGHSWQTEELISELVADTARLCRHQFGNFAIQHILQHGTPAQRSAIAKMLSEDTIRLAKHRIASYTISCALSYCAAEDVKMLTQVVLQDAGQLADLSRRQYGSFVVREVNKAARLQAEDLQ